MAEEGELEEEYCHKITPIYEPQEIEQPLPLSGKFEVTNPRESPRKAG